MSRKTQFSDLGKDGCLLPPTLLCIHEEEDDFNEQGEENLQTLGAVTFADLFAPIRQVRIEPDQTLLGLFGQRKGYLLKFMLDSREMKLGEVIPSGATIRIEKPPLTVSVYLHAKTSNELWNVGEYTVDILKKLCWDKLLDFDCDVTLPFKQLWKDLVTQFAKDDFFERFALYVKSDIIRVPQVARRDALHEMDSPHLLSLYFSVGAKGYFSLRLKCPDFVQEQECTAAATKEMKLTVLKCKV